jgi:hypothetical protein
MKPIAVRLIAKAVEPTFGIGRTPTPEEIKALDISIGPTGEELPPGKGNAKEGAQLYRTKGCAGCHGAQGIGGTAPILKSKDLRCNLKRSSIAATDLVLSRNTIRASLPQTAASLSGHVPLGERSCLRSPGRGLSLDEYLRDADGSRDRRFAVKVTRCRCPVC